MLTPAAIFMALAAPLAASFAAAGRSIGRFLAANAAAFAIHAAPTVALVAVFGLEWATGDTYERCRVAALAVVVAVFVLQVVGKLPAIVRPS